MSATSKLNLRFSIRYLGSDDYTLPNWSKTALFIITELSNNRKDPMGTTVDHIGPIARNPADILQWRFSTTAFMKAAAANAE